MEIVYRGIDKEIYETEIECLHRDIEYLSKQRIEILKSISQHKQLLIPQKFKDYNIIKQMSFSDFRNCYPNFSKFEVICTYNLERSKRLLDLKEIQKVYKNLRKDLNNLTRVYLNIVDRLKEIEPKQEQVVEILDDNPSIQPNVETP